MFTESISRLRRNHGLEHATIHVLSEKHRNFSAQGNSTLAGFHLNIYGDIPETAVMDAVEEAYARMKKGEHHLAVHPNCGTVLLTTAVMATLAAQMVFAAEQRKQRGGLSLSVLINALPTAVLAVVAALIVSKPVGVQLQARYTVEGDLRDMQLVSIQKVTASPVTRLFQLMLTGGQLQATSYKIVTTG
ncbi:MAG TPA: DUF6391 domain-containing protein [Chloroflexota bacterium]|nr:DUF6391 domain-containing protein [Chloroflexota bacterium]